MIVWKILEKLSKGAEEFIPRDNDKDTVLALREIAEGHVTEDNIDLLHNVGENTESNPFDIV